MRKKTFISAHCIFLLLAALTSCTSPLPEQRVDHRTYYESLDLSTPESSVETFINAFQRSDFPTVFWVFSPEAQIDFITSEMEHIGDASYYFDVLMMAAKEHSAFIIDLSGEIKIRDTIALSDNQFDVVASVEGIEGNVIFRTVQSPSKRWRVLQVIVPGGDERQLPWSTPKLPEQ
jgi:hypothetical protein